MSFGVTLSRVCVSVCPPTARHISFGGEGNALYPVLFSYSSSSSNSSNSIIRLAIYIIFMTLYKCLY